jgi:hypothetical protein
VGGGISIVSSGAVYLDPFTIAFNNTDSTGTNTTTSNIDEDPKMGRR